MSRERGEHLVAERHRKALLDVDLDARAIAGVDAAVPDLALAGQLRRGEQFAIAHAAQREVPLAHALGAQPDGDQQQRARQSGVLQRRVALLRRSAAPGAAAGRSGCPRSSAASVP